MLKRYIPLLVLALACFSPFHSRGQETIHKEGQTAQGLPIAIYDGYLLQTHSKVLSGKPLITKNKLEPVGEKKTSSTLARSTASLTTCDERWAQNAMNNLKKAYFSSTYAEAAMWRKIKKVHSLTPVRCATIAFKNYSVIVIDFTMVGEALDSSDNPRGLIWISKIDTKSSKLEPPLYTGVSIDSLYESKRILTVEAIADVDNDGSHEIILHDERYDGNLHSLFSFNNKGLSGKQDLADTSWN